MHVFLNVKLASSSGASISNFASPGCLLVARIPLSPPFPQCRPTLSYPILQPSSPSEFRPLLRQKPPAHVHKRSRSMSALVCPCIASPATSPVLHYQVSLLPASANCCLAFLPPSHTATSVAAAAHGIVALHLLASGLRHCLHAIKMWSAASR